MPRYIVSCEELGHDHFRDGFKIHANDAFEAATTWAGHEDVRSADYWIVGGQPATVSVTQVDHRCEQVGETVTLIVTGESMPVYTARLKVQP